MIGFNQAAKVEMAAKDYEATPLLNGSYDLLRIETVTHLADGQKIDGTLWTNRTGDVLKTYSQAMALETFRVSKAEALKTAGGAELELLPSMFVKVGQPLPHAHRTKQVRYRVHLEGGDPAGAFRHRADAGGQVDRRRIRPRLRSTRFGPAKATEMPVPRPTSPARTTFGRTTLSRAMIR